MISDKSIGYTLLSPVDGNENGGFIPVSRFFAHLGMKTRFSFPFCFWDAGL
jgi:hypothetical protein